MSIHVCVCGGVRGCNWSVKMHCVEMIPLLSSEPKGGRKPPGDLVSWDFVGG